MQGSGFEILVFLVLLAAIAGISWYAFRVRQKQPQSNAYVQALEHLVDGSDALAIQKFKEAIREDSENVDAYLRLGDILRRRGLVKNAIRLHKDLTFRGGLTPAMKARIYRSLLQDYEMAQQYDLAIKTALKILEVERQSDGWVAQKMVQYYERLGQWEKALNTTRKYLNTNSDRVRSRMALYVVFQALELMKEEKGKEARIKLKEALKIYPQCAAAYYYLGHSYTEEERLEDAVREWKRLCSTVPDKAHICFSDLEKACFELGIYTEVEEIYQDLLRRNNKNYRAGIALMDIYTKKGDFDAALEVLNQLKDFDMSPELLKAQQVHILFLKGQYKQAATQAVELLKDHFSIDQTHFECQTCGYISDVPLWNCPQCKSIDSFNI